MTTRETLPHTRSAHPDLDRTVSNVARRKDHWLHLPIAAKVEYLRRALEGVARTARGQVEAATEAKGISMDSPLAGEEWIGGPYVTARVLRLLLSTLEQLRRQGRLVVEPGKIRQRSTGQTAVEVFPVDAFDSILYRGFRAEVWMQPGVTPENLTDHMGGVYGRKANATAAVALVLGAGNVASIAPLDAIHKLFWEGHVTVLKLNPVNDYLGPFIEDAFGDLVRDGYLAVTYGGAEEGAYLCNHPLVDEIHITGSDRTHDLIVFGPGSDGADRKTRNEPLLDKPVTSELGNVSPVVILPGHWSQSDLTYQAENIATQMTQNAGFNCNAAKVLVTHQDWGQRQDFLAELRRVLRHLPSRPAYYPGSEERFGRFLEFHPGAEPMAPLKPGTIPPTLAAGVDWTDSDQLGFSSESFCAFTVETSLPGENVPSFLSNAVSFCNDTLYGTLNAAVVAHPDTEALLGSELEKAIAELRYGTVALNQWAAMGFALGTTPWGAFPGHTLDNVQSGIGTVHNTMMFDRPEKSVIYAPFRTFPKPPWFVTHGNSHRVGERLTRFEADPSLLQLPGIFGQALAG
jgi:hypothetical protein